MRAHRLLAAATAGSLLLTLTPGAVAGPDARIMLITGDLVSTRSGSVIPPATAPYVAGGRLDKALFDVRILLEEGAGSQPPIIVSYAGSPAIATHRARRHNPGGADEGRVLSSIGARAMRVTDPAAFWKSVTVNGRLDPAIRTIHLDRRVRAMLDQSVPAIGAPAAWQRGYTGAGVKVAVLDTGIDADHPDLAGKVVAARSFTDDPDTSDQVGHGTHVAGIIAGSGAASGGRYPGVAPGASLINAKVLDLLGTASYSRTIAAMEWATSQGAKVVNLSIGGPPTDGTDPMSRSVNSLSFGNGPAAGPVFVAAAGDCADPAQSQRITTPAAADAALAVANLYRDGSVYEFSCRGPRFRDLAVKPDIGAPGTDIVSARAAGTSLGFPVDENYTAITGTSMATPHVSGTAALLVQARPGWSSAQRRNRLISTADFQFPAPVTYQGAGQVDADQATDGTVMVDQGKLEFGRITAPVTKQVVYRNPGPVPVTLDLAAYLAFVPPPALSTSQLVVPAGGQATVNVTADPSSSGPESHIGVIIATPTSGTDPLVTLFGWSV